MFGRLVKDILQIEVEPMRISVGIANLKELLAARGAIEGTSSIGWHVMLILGREQYCYHITDGGIVEAWVCNAYIVVSSVIPLRCRVLYMSISSEPPFVFCNFYCSWILPV